MTTEFDFVIVGGGTAGWNGTGRGEAAGQALQSGRRTAGDLGRGDATLSSGEFVDTYTLDVRAGQRLGVELTSDDFDTYILVTHPSGEQDDNDDCEPGQTSRSCLDVVADESGTWRVAVTSYQPGEAGDYALTATVGGGTAGTGGTRGGVQPAAIRGGTRGGGVRGGDARYESGSLEDGDTTLDSGEFADTFEFEGTGEPVTVDLRSRGFDSYLIVRGEDDEQSDNDDYEGALDRSLLVVETERGQTYTATVTSYAAEETGDYDLAIQGEGAPAGAPGQTVAGGTRTEPGRLERADETLRSGEFVDTYTFQGTPGQRLTVDLTSGDFDTYLVVEPPRGETVEDDDGGGETGHSRLEMDLTEPGEYTVYVTSYAAAETGAYRLAIDGTERFGQPAATGRGDGAGRDGAVRPASAPGRGPSRATQPTTRQIADWTLAETFRGELDARDQRLSSGEYTEVHTFDGDAGEPVRIEMTSSAFDTYLMVESPSGEQVENDDYDGAQDRSVVEFTMREPGRYRVTATSYRADETGAYSLRVSQADAMRPDPPAFDRIVGVFAGISDYGGRIGNLDYTAADAVLVRDAMIAQGMRPEDGILLQDADATVAGMEAAFARIARTADERTMFVFFYSGHGGQYPTAPDRSDPDGQNESIELYDAEILDDDFDRMLSGLPSSRMLVVLDACFSGGFAKDVISSPGRMGLFSSEEDVVSAVAVKFEAGGYLSRFFADAAETPQADEDGNGAITALELSQYLHTRYNQDVTGTGRELIVARDTRPEHQKLIVDRGSVGLYDTLFQLGR